VGQGLKLVAIRAQLLLLHPHWLLLLLLRLRWCCTTHNLTLLRLRRLLKRGW
jgi:hypothetical protein